MKKKKKKVAAANATDEEKLAIMDYNQRYEADDMEKDGAQSRAQSPGGTMKSKDEMFNKDGSRKNTNVAAADEEKDRLKSSTFMSG